MEISSRRELDLFLVINGINSEDPYRVFTWKVTYGDIYLMGVKKQFPFSTAANLHLHSQRRHCLSTRQRQPHSWIILCIHSTLRLQLAQSYFWAHVVIVFIGVDGNVYSPSIRSEPTFITLRSTILAKLFSATGTSSFYQEASPEIPLFLRKWMSTSASWTIGWKFKKCKQSILKSFNIQSVNLDKCLKDTLAGFSSLEGREDHETVSGEFFLFHLLCTVMFSCLIVNGSVKHSFSSFFTPSFFPTIPNKRDVFLEQAEHRQELESEFQHPFDRSKRIDLIAVYCSRNRILGQEQGESDRGLMAEEEEEDAKQRAVVSVAIPKSIVWKSRFRAVVSVAEEEEEDGRRRT
ncbi:hypothetical protein LXL04_010979 [Taraxacum kok-saghyz]